MKGSYSQASVQPVEVEASDGTAVIRFVAPPESMFYAAGVSYEMHDGDLRVVIDRCPIRGECRTMVKSDTRLGEGRTTQVRVPFDGTRIVMLHADGQQQVFP